MWGDGVNLGAQVPPWTQIHAVTDTRALQTASVSQSYTQAASSGGRGLSYMQVWTHTGACTGVGGGTLRPGTGHW